MLKGLAIARKYPEPSHGMGVYLAVCLNVNEDENSKERVLVTVEILGMREFVESMTRVSEYVCVSSSIEMKRTIGEFWTISSPLAIRKDSRTAT